MYRTLSHTIAMPREASEPVFLNDGSMLTLRPIGEADVDALIRAFKRMTPEQVRARVFYTLSELPEPIARSMCRVNPEKTIALVATDPDGSEIRGEARVHLDPVTQAAELAIAIDPAFTGKGLGRILVEHLIEASRMREVHEVWGDTQAGNTAMLALTKSLGFEQRRERDDATLVRFSLDLLPTRAHAIAAKG
jgi:ribosomal protein S18 acetylase RimI-like enzyme